jgi:hypothetical protein
MIYQLHRYWLSGWCTYAESREVKWCIENKIKEFRFKQVYVTRSKSAHTFTFKETQADVSYKLVTSSIIKNNEFLASQ